MANVLNTNPLKVDTAFSTKFSAQAGALPNAQTLFIDEIYWLNPASAGDTFNFADGAGVVARTGRCESANQSQVFSMYGRAMNDFSVPTLASGTLYIYYH